MNGTKRLLESNPDAQDSLFWSKRLMAGSPFDSHRAEPSWQPLSEKPSLDEHRAESSRQHVRALNTQFASWVQAQLQSHPDELWEDGVQDYLSHASSIMDKFSDVVNWIKANSEKKDGFPAAGSQAVEKKMVPENNEAKLFQERSTFASVGPMTTPSSTLFSEKSNLASVGLPSTPSTTLFQEKNNFSSFGPTQTPTSFTTQWNSGVFSSSQTPVLFGSQNSVPINHDASDDADDENNEQRPGSPSVKKTDEKGIIVVHEVKCKLYVKSTDPADNGDWKDRGTGQLSIKCKEGVSKGTKESKPTVVVRNDIGKLLLNALLYPGIKTNLQKNSLVAIFHILGDGGGTDGNNGEILTRTFLIRTRTEDDRDKLAAAIKDYAPAA